MAHEQIPGTGAGSDAQSAPMSEREQNGLRGPVKSCTVESVYPPFTDTEGKQYPERKMRDETEYDVDGRVIARRTRNSDAPGWETRYTYDTSGHLLKQASSQKGEPLSEMTYSYDEQGRLLKISDSRRPDAPIIYRYDEHGRKLQVAVSRPEDYRPNVAVAGSPFQLAATAANLPGGGTATTIYDERDRPVEVQVRNNKGEVVMRAVRVYDAQGHVIEEKQILDKPETMLPEEIQARMLEESGLSREQLLEEIRAHLADQMGGQSGPYSESHTYDAHGRMKETRRRMFNQEDMIEISYNERGDKAAEITRGKIFPTADDPNPGPAMAPYSEVHYAYVYDGHGNWTEQTVSYRSSPDGKLNSTNVVKRTLTYY